MEAAVTKTQLPRRRELLGINKTKGLGAWGAKERAANRKQAGLRASSSNPFIWTRALRAREEVKENETEEIGRGLDHKKP